MSLFTAQIVALVLHVDSNVVRLAGRRIAAGGIEAPPQGVHVAGQGNAAGRDDGRDGLALGDDRAADRSFPADRTPRPAVWDLARAACDFHELVEVLLHRIAQLAPGDTVLVLGKDRETREVVVEALLDLVAHEPELPLLLLLLGRVRRR